jgi:hypothetical protein
MAEKKAQVVVTLDADLKAGLESLALAQDRTTAAQVRALIREAVGPYAKGVNSDAPADPAA